METTTVAWAGGLFRRMAAVALVALCLGGLAAPAGATARDEGRDNANDFITWCYMRGGDPYVIEASGSRIAVTCYMGSDTVSCEFYPTHYCWNQDGPLNSGNLPVHEITADPVYAEDPLQPESPAWHVPTGGILELAEDVSFTESTAVLTESEAALSAESSAALGAEANLELVAEATEPVVTEAAAEVAPVDEGIASEAVPSATEAVDESVAAEESIAEPVEAAAPASGQVDAPAEEPVDEQG